MMLKRKRQDKCHATTGSAYRIHGQQDFPCQLPDDGHEWHEHNSEALSVRWRRAGQRMEFTDGFGNEFSININDDGTIPGGVTIFSRN